MAFGERFAVWIRLRRRWPSGCAAVLLCASVRAEVADHSAALAARRDAGGRSVRARDASRVVSDGVWLSVVRVDVRAAAARVLRL